MFNLLADQEGLELVCKPYSDLERPARGLSGAAQAVYRPSDRNDLSDREAAGIRPRVAAGSVAGTTASTEADIAASRQ